MFHPLRVAAVEPLTDDAVAVTFEVPPELRETFRHVPGQHITLRRHGRSVAEVRRTYSVCTPATENPVLTVGIRHVADGDFSTYALKELAAGDTVDVLPPAGRFVLDPRPGHYAAVVGGSGITPVLSIAATLLAREPAARFCLLRSDRTVASAMFLEQTADLKDRHPDRFQLVQTLSREEQHAGLPTGRLDRERLTSLLPALLPVDGIDGWFLCGPYGLVQAAEQALTGLGVPPERVHQEVFHVAESAATPLSGVGAGAPGTGADAGTDVAAT
ncbi:FAD-binding oxidoreductase, partial [Streptomyces sparsus]